MKAAIIALALLLSVVSLPTYAGPTATEAFIDRVLASWEGKTTDELLEVWGVPDAEAIILGRTVITYDLETKKFTFATGYEKSMRTCKIHFSLTSDLHIAKYRWNGHPAACKKVVKHKAFVIAGPPIDKPVETTYIEVSDECNRAASYEKWFSCTDAELEAIGP